MEPAPIWPDSPRYCPGRPFPAYRFVPGLNLHPTGQVGGHSYGKPVEHPSYLPPGRWRENQLYLFGIDLYHQSYFWESHEAWEILWHLTKSKRVSAEPGFARSAERSERFHPGVTDEGSGGERDLPLNIIEGQFLQGLIQNAAAQLKVHVKAWDGARHLSQEAFRRLQFTLKSGVCDADGKFMGAEVEALLQSMKVHYEPLWEGLDDIVPPAPQLLIFP